MSHLLFVVLFCLNANAYVPSSDYIVGRMAKSHGKGVFAIEQDVVFQTETEALTLRESWIIQDGETMRLTVKSGPLLLNFIFSDGKEYFAENEGKVLVRKVPTESLERFFHIRSDKTLSDLLISSKILTLNPLRNRPRPHDLKLIKPENDPYLRLFRLGDEATILMSSSLDPQESASLPGVWVDQETYTIRKLRFPSQVEVVASNYQSLSNELMAPRLRVVTWGSNAAELRLAKASSITKTKDVESSFATNSLAQSPLQWGNSSLVPLIKEFYQRFR